MGLVSRSKQPFQFENIWLKANRFEEIICTWWDSYQVVGSPSFVLGRMLTFFKDLKKWNKDFWHISAQKQNHHGEFVGFRRGGGCPSIIH